MSPLPGKYSKMKSPVSTRKKNKTISFKPSKPETKIKAIHSILANRLKQEAESPLPDDSGKETRKTKTSVVSKTPIKKRALKRKTSDVESDSTAVSGVGQEVKNATKVKKPKTVKTEVKKEKTVPRPKKIKSENELKNVRIGCVYSTMGAWS